MNGSNLLCKKGNRERGRKTNFNSQVLLLTIVSETLLIEIKYLLEAITFRSIQLVTMDIIYVCNLIYTRGSQKVPGIL
jgi:hypothetical protein